MQRRPRARWRWLVGVVAVFALLTPTLGVTRATAQAPATTVTFGAAGDHGDTPTATAVLQAVGGAKLDFFQNLGDLSYGPRGGEAAWCQYLKDNLNAGAGLPPGNPYGESFPFMPATGNHETSEGSNGSDIDNFVKCLPNRLKGQLVVSAVLGKGKDNYGKEYYYDFPAEQPLVRMIVTTPATTLNSNGRYDYQVGNDHYVWLSNAIDSARSAGIPWVVVSDHKQYITAGVKKDEIGSDFFNLLVEKKVDLVLQGHDHTYQRSKQLALSPACRVVPAGQANPACIVNDGATGRLDKGAGMLLVIAAAGGTDNYDINVGDGDFPYFAKTMGLNSPDATSGFLKVTVSRTELTGTFVPGVGLKRFSDTFTITGPATPVPASGAPTSATTSGSNPSPAAMSNGGWVLLVGIAGVVLLAALGTAILIRRRRGPARRARRALD